MPSNLITDENGAVKRGPGRPKGTPNKVTKAAKDLIAEVAEGLGGAQRMLDWAKEDPANEKAFWSQVYPKLLPLQVSNPEGETFKSSVTMIELVAMKKNGEASD